jgi:hypothetical protein
VHQASVSSIHLVLRYEYYLKRAIFLAEAAVAGLQAATQQQVQVSTEVVFGVRDKVSALVGPMA